MAKTNKTKPRIHMAFSVYQKQKTSGGIIYLSGIPASGDRDTAEKLHKQASIIFLHRMLRFPSIMLINLKGKKRGLYQKR